MREELDFVTQRRVSMHIASSHLCEESAFAKASAYAEATADTSADNLRSSSRRMACQP